MKNNALESIERTIAFSPRDWSICKRDAWIYGIVFGWDDLTAECALAIRHGWNAETVARLHSLHIEWAEANRP